MALVAHFDELLAPGAAIDPRLSSRALGAGRVRGTALPLVEDLRASPRGANRRVSRALRAARALHSNERRLVTDLIWDLLRFEDLLTRATRRSEPLAHWLAWLVWRGAEVELAHEEWRAELDGTPLTPDLRQVLQEELEALSESPDRQLAFAGSLDPALAQALLETFPAERCAQLLVASNQRAPTTLRVNARAVTRKRLQRTLAEHGIDTTPTRWSTVGLSLDRRANLVGTAAYRSGWFEIQDEASQLVTRLVPPDARTVIDWCCGAGGKTLALAASHPSATIWSLDVRRSALDELARRARRARLTVRTRLHDQRGSLPPADCVLVDAPCSGSGVLRRHPEHRRTIDRSALADLRSLQSTILSEASGYVTGGGTLIYATCSVLRQENQAVVDAFLDTRPDFELVPCGLSSDLGGTYLELYPDSHGTDGFFAAALRRR